MADERQTQYLLLSMVGAVALVGVIALVVTFAGGTNRTATTVYAADEETANSAGDVINPLPRGSRIRCYDNSDCGYPTVRKSCYTDSQRNLSITNTTTPVCVNPRTTASYCTKRTTSTAELCYYGCSNGACTIPATCYDGRMNGDETGVDCGGYNCAACFDSPTCYDGMMNGDETGVDCGGYNCQPCDGLMMW